MSKKDMKTTPAKGGRNQTRGKNIAKVGAGAAVFALISWLVGGFTRENAYEWFKAFLFAGVLALLIRWPIFEPFKIPSSSMWPTLAEGDRVFVNKFRYGVRFPFNGMRLPFTKTSIWYAQRRIWYGSKPERFDIVVFKAVEPRAEHTTLVKRVIGLPGERVHIANGRVYINGEPLTLPPDMPPVEYTSTIGDYGILKDDAHSLVPKNCYLLLGDHSGASRDGRVFGWMPNEHLLGRAYCIAWPPSRWRDFTGFSKTLWWRGMVGFAAFLLFARLFLGRSWRVRTESVQSSFAQGEHVFINRCAFGLPLPFTRHRLSQGRAPRRGEIVLYHTPALSDGQAHVLLGRVAGLPNEQVLLDEGKLRIDGAPVAEPSLANRVFAASDGKGRYGRSKNKVYSMVPQDHYFILADNTEDAPDSQTFGWIPRSHLIGPVSAVWWPVRKWRRARP